MALGDGLKREAPPLVLTLELDAASFAAFDRLRREHYPPERNFVPAHVTLFRRLPGERAREIKALLRRIVATERPIDVAVGAPRLIERGVAVFLDAPRLHALREALAAEWGPWLDDHDRAGFRPHVTILANTGEAEARRTREAVGATAPPSRLRGLGLHLWRYRDGPWEDVQLFRFRGS